MHQSQRYNSDRIPSRSQSHVGSPGQLIPLDADHAASSEKSSYQFRKGETELDRHKSSTDLMEQRSSECTDGRQAALQRATNNAHNSWTNFQGASWPGWSDARIVSPTLFSKSGQPRRQMPMPDGPWWWSGGGERRPSELRWDPGTQSQRLSARRFADPGPSPSL